MAHFAKLDENNIVVEVNVVNNFDVQGLPFPESESVGVEFLKNWSGGYENWKQTSYNGNFRKNYAGIGYTYREDIDAFVPPQPYPSWTLNDQALWQAPVAMPADSGIEKPYIWDEATTSWIEKQGDQNGA